MPPKKEAAIERTELATLGVDPGTRKTILEVFNMLAKSDFWHDFHTSLIQELLNNTSLSSSISFAERGKRIATIRDSLKGKSISVSDYFMNQLDILLPGGAGAPYKKERELMKTINLNFETMEKECKVWNEKGDIPELLPLQFGEKSPTYGAFQRKYKVSAIPVKISGENKFLPSAFETLSTYKNFILIIDASHLSMTKLTAKGLLPYSGEHY